MSRLLAVGCAAASAWLAAGGASGAARTRRAMPTRNHGDRPAGTAVASVSGRARAPTAPGSSERLRLPVALLAGLAVGLLLGGPVGLLTGAVAASALHRWLAGLESREQRRQRQRLAAELPVAADLLAACLSAGSSFDAAAAAVADALDGPLREVLVTTVATLRLGGDPVQCWRGLERDEVLAPLGRALARAAETGAPVAAAVVRLAEEQRRERRWAAQAAARTVGVHAVAPLGLCFLPAFVLLAIVPVVAGIAAAVLPTLQ